VSPSSSPTNEVALYYQPKEKSRPKNKKQEEEYNASIARMVVFVLGGVVVACRSYKELHLENRSTPSMNS
jgi:hypothetical protein